MSDLPTALDNALKLRLANDFYALKMVLPGATVRLLDGAGTVTFDPGTGNETFTGRDAVYGALDTVEKFKDGFGDSAPALQFSLIPASDGAVAALSSATCQLSSVKAWYGTRNPATNAVDAVSLRFDGFFDFRQAHGVR